MLQITLGLVVGFFKQVEDGKSSSLDILVNSLNYIFTDNLRSDQLQGQPRGTTFHCSVVWMCLPMFRVGTVILNARVLIMGFGSCERKGAGSSSKGDQFSLILSLPCDAFCHVRMQQESSY